MTNDARPLTKPQINNPLLILIRGLPGSGKSYLAAALQNALGREAMVTLDPDDIDLMSKEYLAHSEALTKEGVDQKFHPYRWSRAKAYEAILAHKIVVWTQAFTNLDGFNKTIVNLQNFASEHGLKLPVLVVEVNVAPQLAKERAAERQRLIGRGVSEEAFARFIQDYVSFAGEGHNTVIVSGEGNINASTGTVLEALKKLRKDSSGNNA